MKLIAKIVLGAACALVLAACGQGGGQLTAVTLWYSPYTSDAAPLPEHCALLDTIESELGIRLKAVPYPAKKEEQNDMILKAARSGALPDIFMVNRDVLVQLIRMNQVARVDKMYTMMPHRTAQMYGERERAAASIDGLCYGLSQVGSVERNEGVLIRKDWLDNLGLDVPVTLEDFMTVMQAFTTNDPDRNGKADTYGYGAFIEISNRDEGLGMRFAPFFGAYGVAGTFSAGRSGAGLNVHNAGYLRALEFVRNMVHAKVIDPNWVAYTKDDFREAWKSGRFGMMREQNAAFALESNYKAFDEKFPGGEWIVIDPPLGPDGQRSVGCYTSSHRTFAVSRRASELGKLPAIARLLEWMSTDGYDLVAYGVEGVNFSYGEDGAITTDNLPDPEQAYTTKNAAPILQLRNLVFCAADKELESRYPTWHTANGKEMSALRTLREMQEKPWTQSVEIPAPSPELKKFYEQGVLEFVTGRRNLSPETWNDWLAEFDRMGGTDWETAALRYLAETNAYVDGRP